MANKFGAQLKDWRKLRRLSQLDLGMTANVSPRHIAFLETGRSHPSRSMVAHLSEALNVPRPARNALLTAAGFATSYRSREPDEADMAQVRAAIDWMLTRHAPFPGIAIDQHWNLVSMNEPAMKLYGAVGLKSGDSLLDAMLASDGLRQVIENWTEVAAYMLARLRTENAYFGGDPVLERAIAILSDTQPANNVNHGEALPPIVPVKLRLGELQMSFFSAISQFGTAEDIALSQLRIELLFPADEATRLALLR